MRRAACRTPARPRPQHLNGRAAGKARYRGRDRRTATNLVGSPARQTKATSAPPISPLRPLLRPGEVVENIPGVIVTQHSGSGKANQYFLRGFNLDHGTDLALSVDGVPVNMPSHAHGQGYADLNFVIPGARRAGGFQEGTVLRRCRRLRLGRRVQHSLLRPAAGGAAWRTAASSATAGRRRRTMPPFGGGNLIYAGELRAQRRTVDTRRRRHSAGRRAAVRAAATADGFTSPRWRITTTGGRPTSARSRHRRRLIGRWGAIDTTDAGTTGRYSLTADWHALGAQSSSHCRVRAALRSRSLLRLHLFPQRPGARRPDRATGRPVRLRRAGDAHALRHALGARRRTPSASRSATTTSTTACTTRRRACDWIR